MNLGAPDGWWQALYDDAVADILLEREHTPNDVADFLVERLRLLPGARVFDQCCGIGSLAVPLAARGFCAVGCDLIPRYIARAREHAQAAGVHVEFSVADAFAFAPAVPCAGAFNWWTSFGYARDDRQNLQMLRRACESLVPGGVFALDTMNVPNVIANFQPVVTLQRGELNLVRESALDIDAGLLHKRWTISGAERAPIEHASTVRLHTPWELRALLLMAGFAHVELLGGIDGSPLTTASQRCIAIATKGAA